MRATQAATISDPQTRRRRSNPRSVTWVLLGLAVLNLLVIPLAIHRLARPDLRSTSADYVRKFASRIAGVDSWQPMQLAIDHIRAASSESIYSSLFFHQKIKFQYPPSSLLSMDLLESVRGRPVSMAALNTISWFCVLAVCALVPAIYLAALKRFNRDLWNRTGRLDLVLQSATLFAMSLGFYPVTKGFYLGQIQTWLTCLFAAAVLAWLLDRETLSGILIGLIVTIKPQLAVLLVWGAIQRRRKFLVGSVSVVVPLEALSLWRYGLRNQLDYLSVLSFLSSHGESFYANQSVNGLLARMLRVGPNTEWAATAFPPFNAVVYYGTVAMSLLMIALALFWKRKDGTPQSMLLKFLMASLLVTMASPIAWEHHYGIMAPMFAVFLPVFLKPNSGRGWLLALAGSYIATSNCFLFVNLAANTRWNFVQSYIFGGAALLILTVLFQDASIDKDPRAKSTDPRVIAPANPHSH
jgi:hypothetical protein